MTQISHEYSDVLPKAKTVSFSYPNYTHQDQYLSSF